MEDGEERVLGLVERENVGGRLGPKTMHVRLEQERTAKQNTRAIIMLCLWEVKINVYGRGKIMYSY